MKKYLRNKKHKFLYLHICYLDSKLSDLARKFLVFEVWVFDVSLFVLVKVRSENTWKIRLESSPNVVSSWWLRNIQYCLWIMFELIFNSKDTLWLFVCLEIKKANFVDSLLSIYVSYTAYTTHRDTLNTEWWKNKDVSF